MYGEVYSEVYAEANSLSSEAPLMGPVSNRPIVRHPLPEMAIGLAARQMCWLRCLLDGPAGLHPHAERAIST